MNARGRRTQRRLWLRFARKTWGDGSVEIFAGVEHVITTGGESVLPAGTLIEYGEETL